jgi:hypothetical protein
MSKDDVIQMQGEVLENLPNANFRVKVEMGMSFLDIFPEGCGCITFASFLVTRSPLS